jgi:hypothetical protein
MEIKKQKVVTNVAVLTKEDIDELHEWLDNLESPCERISCYGIDCKEHKCPIKELDDVFDRFIIALKRELDAIKEKQARAVYEND